MHFHVPCRVAVSVLLLALVPLGSRARAGDEYLAPTYRGNPSIDPILAHVRPGTDAFPLEKPAEEIGDALAALGQAVKKEAAGALAPILAEGFHGAALRPARETTVTKSASLEVFRADGFPESVLDAGRFRAEWTAFLEPYARIDTFEVNVLTIDAGGADAARASILADYDVVGPGRTAARVERRGHWHMDWQKDAGGWRVSAWKALDETRSAAKDPVFTEVSETAFAGIPAYREQLVSGVDYWRTRLDGAFMPDVLGHNGVSAGDVDGDGFDDLYVCQPAGLPNRLFHNRGDGTFEDITDAAGVGILDASSMSLFADVDNDGDQDLIVVTFTQPLLFLNDGKGHFTEKPHAFKSTEPPKGYLTSAAVADYDRDGFLDVYICVYSFFLGEGKYGLPSPYHDARNGPPNILFKNDGLGGFVDVTKETIVDGNDRFSFAAAWGDIDGDGWPDLQVANDFGRKNLYRNSGKAGGKVTLKDVASAAGTEDYASAGMSAAWLDFNRDGRPDIYFGNMWAASGLRVTQSADFMPGAPADAVSAFRRHARGNTLYENLGDGRFKDVSLESGAEMGRWAWSSDAFDFDSDGWEDLYVVNGLVSNEDPYSLDSFFWRQTVARSPLDRKPKKAFEDGWKTINRLLRAHGTQAGWERNVLLRNDGAGHFDHVEGAAGLDLDDDGRAFAVSDLDHDGDPDLVVMARSGPRLRVFRNDYRGRESALVLRLVGKGGNRDAIGARVTVETDEGRSVKLLQAGSGFLSQHSKELHFGLGHSRAVNRVTVRWPDGQEQTFTGVAVNQRVSLEEGTATPTRSEPFAPAPTSAPAETKASDRVASFEYRGTWLWQPYPAPDFSLDVEGRGRETLVAQRGKTVLLHLFAPRGTACGAALSDLASQRAALEAAGVTVLALGLDEAGKVRTFARAHAPGLPVAVADEPTTLAYSVVLKYLFDRADEIVLPTSLLLDAKGDIVKVYRGPVPAAQMLADAPHTVAAADERLTRAVPFAGRFYAPPPGRNYFQIGIELSLQGLDGPALAAFEKGAATAPEATTLQNLGTLYLKKGQTAKARASFERALSLQRDYPEASNSLGALLAQNGDVPGAIAQFQAALKGRPDYADAMNNLGYAYLQTGRGAEALRLFQQAVAADPNLAEAYNNLGIYEGQQDALEKAETYFRTATQKKPRYSEAVNNLAMVIGALGRPAEAVKLLQDSIQDDPAFEMSYVTLCRIYLDAGRTREAAQVLERLLQRNPKHPAGLQLLQQIQGAAPRRAPAH
jgi:Flp pilus assembly protein TadD/peroxiredoxin